MRVVIAKFALLVSFVHLISCSGFKLDKSSNCLNEESGCFRFDNTQPTLVQSVPAAGESVSVLTQIDLTFSEELNNPQPSDFILVSPGNGLVIGSVQKISTYGYRLVLSQSSVQNGVISLNYSNVKDYNGNKANGTLVFTGNVNIGISFVTDLVGNPGFRSGVSNGGGFTTSTIQFFHDYNTDNNNSWQMRVSTGAIGCSAGTQVFSGSGLLSGVANKVSQTLDRITHFPGGPGTYRIIVCIENPDMNKQGIASLLLVRDDTPPTLTYTPPADGYALPQSIVPTCGDNADKIIYTMANQVSSYPTAPTDPLFNANGTIGVGTVYSGSVVTPSTPNPHYIIYKWLCLDKGGNLSVGGVQTAQYIVDTNIPAVTVNLDSSYKSFVSSGGYTSSTLKFTTNRSAPDEYKIVQGAISCTNLGTGSELVPPTTLPGSASTPVEVTLDTATHFTVAQTYHLRICVKNATNDWGFAYLQITRDDTIPTITPSVSGGSYGAVQYVSLTCSGNYDKVAFTYNTANGTATPADPLEPTFDANGNILTGSLQTGPYETPDISTTKLRYKCISKAGRQSIGGQESYLVDTILPNVTIVSNTSDFVSNLAGATNSTDLTFQVSRAGLNYEVKSNSTNCTGGTILASGVVANANENITVSLNTTTHFPAVSAYNIKICVTNLIGSLGYSVTSKIITRDDTRPGTVPGVSIVSTGSGNYTLNWNAATDANGIMGYRIYRSETSGVYGVHDYTSAGTSLNVTGLNDANTYYFVVKAVDMAGNLSLSNSTEKATRYAMEITVSGLNPTTVPFRMRSAGETLSFTTNGPQTLPVTFLAGSTYQIEILSQPDDNYCAFQKPRYGTASNTLNIGVNCMTAYPGGKRLQAVPVESITIFQHKGRVGNWVTSALTKPNELLYFNDTLYFADETNSTGICGLRYCIYSASATATGTASSILNDLSNPVKGMTTDGEYIYFGMGTHIYTTRMTGTTPVAISNGYTNPVKIELYDNNLLVSDAGVGLVKVDLSNYQKTLLVSSGAIEEFQIVGSDVYFTGSGSHAIRKIPLSGGAITVVAGNHSSAGYQDGTSALFNTPKGLLYDGKNNLYVADYGNHRIRRIHLRSGRTTTIAGNGITTHSDGTGLDAQLPYPYAITTNGKALFVSLHTTNKIVKINDSGLVGRWPLGKATALHDYNSDNSTINNATWSSGTADYSANQLAQTNASAVFNGSNTKITSGTPITTASACNVSISAWVKSPNPPSGIVKVLAYVGNTANSGFGLRLNAQGQPELHFGGINTIPSSFTMESGKWIHIAATCYDSYRWKFFINGRLMNQTYNSSIKPSTTAPAIFQIGKGDGGGTDYFSGNISDVRLYARALNESEITELAQEAVSSLVYPVLNDAPLGLLSHYMFETGTVSSTLDSRGVLSNTLSPMGGPSPEAGKDGEQYGSLQLGSGKYVNASNTLGLPTNEHPRTMCAWVKLSQYPDATFPVQTITAYGATSDGRCADLSLERSSTTGKQMIRFGTCGTGNYLYAGYQIPLRSWTHICGTLQTGNTTKIFVNAKEVGIGTGVISLWQTVAGIANHHKVGNSDGAGANQFYGNIDDVRIYDNALSDMQIRQLGVQVPSGILARYDFNASLDDVSGFGANVQSGGYETDSDRYADIKMAVSLNRANNDHVYTAPKEHLGNVSAHTISAWIKPATLPAMEQIYTVVSKNNNSPKGFTFGLWNDNGTQRLFLTHGTSLISYTAKTDAYAVPLGAYSHIAVTQQGSSVIFYVNGSELTNNANTINSAPDTAYENFNIGRDYSGNYFHGTIDELRYYGRALSQAEIQILVQHANKQIKITGSTYNGNLKGVYANGILGADAKCAADYGVNYKAMLADSTPIRRACLTGNCSDAGVHEHIDWVLRPNLTYIRGDGITPIFTANWNGIWDFTGGNITPITSPIGLEVWTGLETDWRPHNANCSGWQDSGIQNGRYGVSNAANVDVISKNPANCDSQRYLYCVEQ